MAPDFVWTAVFYRDASLVHIQFATNAVYTTTHHTTNINRILDAFTVIYHMSTNLGC